MSTCCPNALKLRSQLNFQNAAINSCLIKANLDQLSTFIIAPFLSFGALVNSFGLEDQIWMRRLADFRMRTILSFPNVSRNDGQLLHTVLNNMSQGVLLFDSELKLVICNQRYIEMYGLCSGERKAWVVRFVISLITAYRLELFLTIQWITSAQLEECIVEGKSFQQHNKTGRRSHYFTR